VSKRCRWLAVLTVGLCILTMAPLGWTDEDQCKDILAGIWDIQSSSGSSVQADSWSRWFCSTEEQSLINLGKSGESGGLTVGVPIDAVPVQFGFNASDSNAWQNSVKTTTKEGNIFPSNLRNTIDRLIRVWLAHGPPA
jgi:hypothetical protein